MCFYSYIACIFLCLQEVVSVPNGHYGLDKNPLTKEVYMQSPSYTQKNFAEPYYLGIYPTLNTPTEENTNRQPPRSIKYPIEYDTQEIRNSHIDSKKIRGSDALGTQPKDLLFNQAQQNRRIPVSETKWPEYQTNIVPTFSKNGNLNAKLRQSALVNKFQQEPYIQQPFQNLAAVTRPSVLSANHYSPAEQIDKTENRAWKDLSNSNQIQDAFVSPPKKKRYMIVNPDGSVEIFNTYDEAAKKYPNHFLVRSNEVEKIIHSNNKQVTPNKLLLQNILSVSTQKKSLQPQKEVNLPYIDLETKDSRLRKSENLAFRDFNKSVNINAAVPFSVNNNFTIPKVTSNKENKIEQLRQANNINSNVVKNQLLNTEERSNFTNTKEKIKVQDKPVNKKNIARTEKVELTITEDINPNIFSKHENSNNDSIQQLNLSNDVNLFNDTELNESIISANHDLIIDNITPTTSNIIENSKNDKFEQPNLTNNVNLINATEFSESVISAKHHLTTKNINPMTSSIIVNSKNDKFKQLNLPNNVNLLNVTELGEAITTADHHLKSDDNNSTTKKIIEESSNNIIEPLNQPNDVNLLNVTEFSKTFTTKDHNLTVLKFRNITHDDFKHLNEPEIFSPINNTKIAEFVTTNYTTISIENTTNDDIKLLKQSDDINVTTSILIQNITNDKIQRVNQPNDVNLFNVTEFSKPINNKVNNLTLLGFSNITQDKFEHLNEPEIFSSINKTITDELATTVYKNISNENSITDDIKQLKESEDINSTMPNANSTNDIYENFYQHIDVNLFNVTESSESVTTADHNLTLLSFTNIAQDELEHSNDSDNFSFEIDELATTSDKNIENSTIDEFDYLNQFDDDTMSENITDMQISSYNLPQKYYEEVIGSLNMMDVDIQEKSDNLSDNIEDYTDDSTEIMSDVHDIHTLNSNEEENNTPKSYFNDTYARSSATGTKIEAEFHSLQQNELAELEPSLETDNISFWSKIAGNDTNKTIFFIAVPAKPILSKETRTVMYPNGVVVEEVRETIQNDDGAPVTTVSKVIYPKDTYRYT